jgi:hypothetical protein
VVYLFEDERTAARFGVEQDGGSVYQLLSIKGLFRLQIFATGDTVALSFVFNKFYLIMD